MHADHPPLVTICNNVLNTHTQVREHIHTHRHTYAHTHSAVFVEIQKAFYLAEVIHFVVAPRKRSTSAT